VYILLLFFCEISHMADPDATSTILADLIALRPSAHSAMRTSFKGLLSGQLFDDAASNGRQGRLRLAVAALSAAEASFGWTRIAVRAIGSWMAASGLLLLGWILH
jgi:hypothetical protein